MQNLLNVPALVLAAREAKALEEAKSAAAEAAKAAKKRKIRRCDACNRRSKSTSSPPTSEWYPIQGAGPDTACRFTIKHTREIIVGVGPTSYHNARTSSAFAATVNKITSSRGVSLGARLAPLFYQRTALTSDQNTTAPSRYNITRFPRPQRKNLHPFNSSTPRRPLFLTNEGPGPGSYEILAAQNRRIPFLEHLGSGRTMVTAVTIRCTPACDALCDICGEVPVGDYWRTRTRTLCRECKRDEQSTVSPLRINSAPHPNNVFKKMRSCSEVHCHEGTNAAIRLRTERQQQRSRVNEAYLSLYFP